MSREEFLLYYANGSKLGVEDLLAMGAEPIPCDCGSSMCQGWRMTFPRREARSD